MAVGAVVFTVDDAAALTATGAPRVVVCCAITGWAKQQAMPSQPKGDRHDKRSFIVWLQVEWVPIAEAVTSIMKSEMKSPSTVVGLLALAIWMRAGLAE